MDNTTKILNSVNGQLTRFVTQMWLEEDKLNWLLNFLALGMVYLVLVFVINRFWVATAVFAITMSVYAVANSIKIILRNEPILPSDLSFLSSGNGGEITSFIPKSSQALVDGTITMLIWLTVICLILQFVDGRRCVIPFHWWRPFRNVKTIIGNVTRIIAAAMSITLLCSFTWTLSIPGAWGYEWAKSWGDAPQLWNAEGDAANNGPIINFLRLTHPKIMDKPEGYSQETMEELAKKYSSEANQINGTRANNLTDNSVIMILSESFSDPTRVPGIALAEDPMPNIRALNETTTSGLMLSPAMAAAPRTSNTSRSPDWTLPCSTIRCNPCIKSSCHTRRTRSRGTKSGTPNTTRPVPPHSTRTTRTCICATQTTRSSGSTSSTR